MAVPAENPALLIILRPHMRQRVLLLIIRRLRLAPPPALVIIPERLHINCTVQHGRLQRIDVRPRQREERVVGQQVNGEPEHDSDDGDDDEEIDEDENDNVKPKTKKITPRDVKHYQYEEEQQDLEKAKKEYLRRKKIAQRGGDGEHISA